MARPRRIPYPPVTDGSFADRLGRLLELRSMSPRQASLRAGVSADTARNYLRSRASGPRGKTLDGLATALGVSADVLMGRSPIPDPLPPLDSQKPAGSKPQAPADDTEALAHAITAVSAAETAHITARPAAGARRLLMSAVGDAMAAAVSDGMDPSAALRAVIQSAMLEASGGGMEMPEVLDTVAGSAGVRQRA